MAKYCVNCGRELPEGVDVCPVCGSEGRETGAALFTQITAATEAWKAEGVKKEKPPRTEKQKQSLIYTIAAAVFLVLAVAVILYIQPVNKVIRAVNAGQYAEAKDLYWGDRNLASGSHDKEIQRAVLKAADQVLANYANHDIDGDEAASALSILAGVGLNSQDLLADSIASFNVFSDSQNHMDQAQRLSRNGEFLAARDEYLLVLEGDADYDAAQEKARASLDLYGDSVLSDANVLIQSGDYAGAIQALEEGEKVLRGYEVYNEKLAFKLSATYELYEADLLTKAAEKAGDQDYAGAAELLRAGMDRFDYETENLTAAEADYLQKALDKAMSDAAAEAFSLYENGDAAGAFALLDALLEDPEADQGAVSASIAALEERFAADKIAEARERFGNSREKLPEAVNLLSEALKLRDLEEIQEYKEDISRYLPASLADSEFKYAEKEGQIFRNSGVFESLDGTNYTDGWVWGEDGAEVTFDLEGNYDLLEAVFAIRREDETEAEASFEILCDGEVVYASEPLVHPVGETVPVSVPISGCKTLTLRFHTNYSVRTAEDGYCYHGLCSPVITKNI